MTALSYDATPGHDMKTNASKLLAMTALVVIVVVAAGCRDRSTGQRPATSSRAGCEPGNGGLTLPQRFCASVFADNLGHARHIGVSPTGEVYVNTWSSTSNKMTNAPGGFVVVLRDADRDGKAERVERFGSVFQPGKPGGGTGLVVKNGMLYVEDSDRIVRYKLEPGDLVPAGPPETILSGLPMEGDHPMHPFAVRANETLFVNSGSASNACQKKNRALESPGRDPCPELDSHAGLWRYDGSKTGQIFSPKERYATGLRNTVALTTDPRDGGILVVVQGRDQLSDNWPKLYTPEQNNELPAEIFARVEGDEDFGWPYCYYDARQEKYVLAPEYGGDGGKAQGECTTKAQPEGTFPAHWAPEAIVIYRGSTFPRSYQGGAFISFHGSWNRRPAQAGYLVAFVPLRDGIPEGTHQEFATGFAGTAPPAQPADAAHRPMGLAVGPDGALYVGDDVTGRIWRIVYQGR
jgi:glucose/arabinose dehydrogenase